MHDRVKQVSQIIGSNIKRIRKKKQLTQLELEVATGIDRGKISKIEAGQGNLELATIIRLADALETPIGDFFK